MADRRILVGDVGGTHARFAIADTSQPPFPIEARSDLETDKFDSFAAAVRAYVEQIGARKPKAVALAVAGPITKGRVHFTNSGWELSEEDLRALGFARAILINDFAALAFSVTSLPPTAFRAIGPDREGLAGAPITILGAGTGLGVSCLARYRGRAVPLASEGGHMSFAPIGDQQLQVLCVLSKRFGHVSLERVLSGPGLENLYSALEEIAGRKPTALEAPEISHGAERGDPACRAAQDMFCAIYGAAAGDFALAHGARGGVYIAGGIAAKIEDYLIRSRFRAAFEDKGRLADFVKPIPTRLILDKDAAFLGAACASLEFQGEHS
ncbi:MAG: glucokinase [Alphaproteobacteria bacterium]|nr:glucokinase [Alphaproteobacteria bacterium]